MKIKEYRIVLPMSVEEYQVGQLYAVAEVSKSETGGGEGVEVLINEPYENDDGEKGQYTHKIYHLKYKVPKFIRILAPKGSLEIHEKAWNAYPYCRTILTNDYMKHFTIKIETWHKEDMGELENVHELDVETRRLAKVTDINIADINCINQCDYKAEYDPASVRSCRGPLGPDWKEELANNPTCPHMCAYKLVTVEFKWWGLQTRVEKMIHEMEERLFATFHRQLFCSIDKWINLSMDDIRCIEEETKKELDELRANQGVKGMQVED